MAERDDLTLELARAGLEAVSPEEVALIDAVGPELLQAVEAPRAGDGSLGFGVVEVALSTAVMFVSRAVADLVVDVAKDVAADEAAGFLRRVINGMRQRRNPSGAQPITSALRPDDVARARRVAYDRAIAAGVDEGKAGLLADAIAGSLAATG